MKQWFRLTLVCGALVGLLLGLTQVVGLNDPLPVVGSGSWFDRGREPVSDAPAVSLIRSMKFDPARATPLEFLVLDCALNAGNISPPGQQTYGRPELLGPWRVASPTRQLKATPSGPFLENYWFNRPNLKNRSSATAFS
jgi:hypothetical protein